MGGKYCDARELGLNPAYTKVRFLKVSQHPPPRAGCIAMAQEFGLDPGGNTAP